MSDLELKMDDWTSLRYAASQSEKKPTLNVVDRRDREKLVVVPMGDMHLGSRSTDEPLIKENLEWILDTKAEVIFMGDQLECATRDSIGSGVYEQQEIIDKQIEHFMWMMDPLVKEDLVIGIHPGNHEDRTFKASGVNITKMMAREMGVKYLGIGALHYFRVGDQRYTMYTTHGASGAVMPHTKIKAALRLADMVDADIYCHAHVHQLSHHVKNFYKPNLRNRTVEEKQKHFVITGAYLDHWGSYGHAKAYEPMRKGSPKIKMNGQQERIRVSL